MVVAIGHLATERQCDKTLHTATAFCATFCRTVALSHCIAFCRTIALCRVFKLYLGSWLGQCIVINFS